MRKFNFQRSTGGRKSWCVPWMPRKTLIESDTHPYHLMNRSNNKEFFYLSGAELWPIFIEVLAHLQNNLGCEIHSFVMMSNHYHLVLSTPRCNLSESMTYLHREVAKRANKVSGRMNHFFGGRYKWSRICDETYFWNTIKYVLRNPVEAEICSRVEDYKFSSLNTTSSSVVWSTRDVFATEKRAIELDLDWLNDKFIPEHKRAIQKGLRRREFGLPPNRSGSKQVLDPMRRKKGLGT
jgi:REP element-mobilizing transposase RayT